MEKKIKIFQKDNKKENEILRKISEEIKKEDIEKKEIQDILKSMIKFIEIQPDGAALAAPQIGINKRIFIINPKIINKKNEKNFDSLENCVFINPKIINTSKKKELLEEGCFSVRHWYGKVNRYKNTTIKYFDGYGNEKEKNSGGLLSQIFQHEIEHLDGILFSDKAFALEKMSEKEIKILEENQKILENEKNKNLN